MPRKKCWLLSLLLFLLLTGCSFQHIVKETANEPFFVNCESDFVKQNSIIYFIDSGNNPMIRFLDLSTGNCMPLCGKPDCTHDNKTCNASISTYGFARLMLYNERLYWIGADSGFYALYSINTDGSQRRKEMDIDIDLYSLAKGKGTAEITDDVLFVCGTSEYVLDGKPAIHSVVFRQRLGDDTAQLIYRSDERSVLFGRIYEGILYFAESELWYSGASDDDDLYSLKLYSYDINKEELCELFREERSDAYYRYLFADDNMLYLGGYHKAGVFSLKDESFSVYDAGGRQIDIGDRLLIRWREKNMFTSSDFDNSWSFDGSIYNETIEGVPYGRIFIGSGDRKMYYYSCFVDEDDVENWWIIEIDNEMHNVKPLWHNQVIYSG